MTPREKKDLDRHIEGTAFGGGESGEEAEHSFISVRKASEFLHVSKRTIYRLVEKQGIPFVRFGRTIRLPKWRLLAWVKENGVPEKQQEETVSGRECCGWVTWHCTCGHVNTDSRAHFVVCEGCGSTYDEIPSSMRGRSGKGPRFVSLVEENSLLRSLVVRGLEGWDRNDLGLARKILGTQSPQNAVVILGHEIPVENYKCFQLRNEEGIEAGGTVELHYNVSRRELGEAGEALLALQGDMERRYRAQAALED